MYYHYTEYHKCDAQRSTCIQRRELLDICWICLVKYNQDMVYRISYILMGLYTYSCVGSRFGCFQIIIGIFFNLACVSIWHASSNFRTVMFIACFSSIYKCILLVAIICDGWLRKCYSWIMASAKVIPITPGWAIKGTCHRCSSSVVHHPRCIVVSRESPILV